MTRRSLTVKINRGLLSKQYHSPWPTSKTAKVLRFVRIRTKDRALFMWKWLLTRYNLQYLSRSDPKEGNYFQKNGKRGAGDRWFRGAWHLSWALWHMSVVLAWRKKEWGDHKLGASLGYRNDTVLWNRNVRKDLWFHKVSKKRKRRKVSPDMMALMFTILVLWRLRQRNAMCSRLPWITMSPRV